MREALIIKLPKKGKTNTKYENKCPIILSKILAKRLEEMRPGIVWDDQNGFIKGKAKVSYYKTCSYILNILYNQKEEKVAAVLSLDAKKILW